MRALATAAAILALTGCMPKPDVRAACEDSIRGELLNPETAEFHDFETVDAATVKAALVPTTEGEPAYSAANTIASARTREIESSAGLFRIRVRAEGQLGNTVTKLAYCRQPVATGGACFCSLVD